MKGVIPHKVAKVTTWKSRDHFDVASIVTHRIYYKEGGNCFPNLGHVSVVNPNQVTNPKLAPFVLTSYVIWLMQMTYIRWPWWSHCSNLILDLPHTFFLVQRVKEHVHKYFFILFTIAILGVYPIPQGELRGVLI